ncbi:MAG: DUF5320 domain-containing protein [Ignavibacteria bacterium]
MPNLNGTGPVGNGPMTGKKLGKCNRPNSTISDNSVTDNKETTSGLKRDNSNRGKGNGFGFSRGFSGGRGFGFGRGFGGGRGRGRGRGYCGGKD